MELSSKRVLVTGADGFIVSHLTETLLSQAASARAFVFHSSFNSSGCLDAPLACDEAAGHLVNIGSGTEISVGGLASKLVELIAPGRLVVSESARMRPERSEVERLLADITLECTLTGWEPRVPLREGLARAIEWFREGYEHGIYSV
jgi:nucleoside-diphosphate-sugar epimerase